MHALSFPFLRPLRPAVPIVLRAVVGVIIAYHGWLKIQAGPGSGFAGFVDSLGVPFPTFTAYLVSYLEFLGGLALIIGLLTRVTGLLLVLEMIGTTLLVKTDVGLIAPQGGGAGAEIDLALLVGFLSLVVLGPGAVSVDHAIGIETPAEEPDTRRHAREVRMPGAAHPA